MRSALLFVLAAACTGSSSPGPVAGDPNGGDPDGSRDPSGAGGMPTGSGDLVSATITSKGGASPSPGPGSTCTVTDETYTYDGVSHLATWRVCEQQSAPQGNTFVYTYVVGHTVLPADTAAQLETAIANLQPPPAPCASDVQDLFAITWTTGTTQLGDCAQGRDAVLDIFAGLN